MSMVEPNAALGGYDADAGHNAHEAGRPRRIPVPSLLRVLLSEHLDPGYAAAAARARGSATGTGRSHAVDWLWQALAALVLVVVFAAAVAQARSLAPGVRVAQKMFAATVRSAEASTGELASRRNALSAQVDIVQRRTLTNDAEGQRLLAHLDRLSLAAASTPISGPGLRVRVTDPGISRNLSDVSKQRVAGSQQIILDRDLQLVINSLWASGAKAISVGGARIGPNATIRQAGGAILVDNNPISSPYTVLAIGPGNAMREAFERSAGLNRLRLLEISYGVSVNVSVDEGLSLPAGAIHNVRFAKPTGPV